MKRTLLICSLFLLGALSACQSASKTDTAVRGKLADTAAQVAPADRTEAGYRLYDAPWKNNREPIQTVEDTLPTIPHVRNFLECSKTREQPNAPVEVGHRAVCGPHLANIAMKTKRMAFLNPEATEIY